MDTTKRRRKSRCNGITLPLNPYSIESGDLFRSLLADIRAEFIRDTKDLDNFVGEIAVGMRVHDDFIVWETLRSAATEEQFKAEPVTWIYDALQDCGERDWWYMSNNKQWE